jgi:hypothetical protein
MRAVNPQSRICECTGCVVVLLGKRSPAAIMNTLPPRCLGPAAAVSYRSNQRHHKDWLRTMPGARHPLTQTPAILFQMSASLLEKHQRIRTPPSL